MIATVLNTYQCVKCHSDIQAPMWFGRCPTCGTVNSMRFVSAMQPEPEPVREEPKKRPVPPQFQKRRTIVQEQQTVIEAPSAERTWIDRVTEMTKQALGAMGLRPSFVSSVLTPNSALLKFAGGPRFTVDSVNRKRSEFLTTHGLNVVSVRPEPGAIVISIARPEREVVKLDDVWSRWQPQATDTCNSKLAIGVRESDGAILFLEPETRHAPHTLIAGSTGSGKSVLMQNILLAIGKTNTPAQAEVVLIDPKLGVDYFAFDDMPHMREPTITNIERSLVVLSGLVEEMERRYRQFKSVRVANLNAFNRRVPEQDRLPIVWLIHDEFSEWMMVDEYKTAVSSIVSRLGVKARAAGIYLVFAAQRPDANVMPMQLRANLGNRLILRVDSVGTSEIALGESGGEQLLGRGHMIAKLDGEPGLQFAQVPYVDIERVSMGEYKS